MLTKPISKAMALLVVLSLSLPNPALALRTREAGELPETLSGLEEALQTSPDAVLHEIGRAVRSLLPKPLTPSIPAAGLEELGRPEVPAHRRALLIGGVGNIGRGHIAPLLSRNDFDILFADYNQPLIAAANEQDSYVVTPVGSGDPMTVRHFWGIDARDQELVAAQGARADWIFTTVGNDNIIKLRDVVYRFIQNRVRAGHRATLNIVFAENLPIDQPQIAALRQAILDMSDSEIARYVEDHVNFIGAPPAEDFREYERDYVGWPGAVVSITVPPTLTKTETGNPLDISVEGGGPYELVVDGKELKNTPFVPSGITLVDNIRAAREKKLLIHNMGHVAFAYLAWVLGMEPGGNPALAIQQDPRIARIVRRAMEESAAGLLHRYPTEFTRTEMNNYIDELLGRFANVGLNDTVERIARQTLERKLGENDRLFGAAISAKEAGVDPEAITLAIAAAIRYAKRVEGAMDEKLAPVMQLVHKHQLKLPESDEVFQAAINRLAAGLEEGAADFWLKELFGELWEDSGLSQYREEFLDSVLSRPSSEMREAVRHFIQSNQSRPYVQIPLWGWLVSSLWKAQEHEEAIRIFQEEVIELIPQALVEPTKWLGFSHFVMGLMALETWEATGNRDWLAVAEGQFALASEHLIAEKIASTVFNYAYFQYGAMVQYLQGDAGSARRMIEEIPPNFRDYLSVTQGVITALEVEGWVRKEAEANKKVETALTQWEQMPPEPQARPHVQALILFLFDRLEGHQEGEAKAWRVRLNALYDRWSPAGLEEPKIVLFAEKLDIHKLRAALDEYNPWGFRFYNGSEEPENYVGGKAGFSIDNPWKRWWPLRLLIGFLEKADLPIDNSWQGKGWWALNSLIQGTERPRFYIKIVLDNADPKAPPNRTFAIIVGHSAGLEERNLNRIFSQLADSIQGSGVVVFGPETDSRTGLEELVRLAPPEFLKRMVFWVGAARAAQLQKLNPAVQVVPDNDVNKLAALLISLPEADRVTVLGTLSLAQLQRLLPTTMAVIQLDPSIAFQLILAALGIPNSVLKQVDAAGLEESLAHARAA